MNIKITPGKLSGTVEAVSSKSDAHRKIIASALADKPTEITLNRLSDDIEATLECIAALGGGYTKKSGAVIITPIEKKGKSVVLDFRESGSTARFLIPVASAIYEECHFSGRGRLPDRPFGELIGQLKKHSVSADRDALPIKTNGLLGGGEFFLPGDVSSQYISGLMFALPLLDKVSSIDLTSPLKSSAYVDMTMDTLSEFGVKIENKDGKYIISPCKYCSLGKTSAEGDWSNAAFWIAADRICGNVEVTGLSQKTYQGDIAISRLLDSRDIDASQIPDLVPILSVLAASRSGKTVIRKAERLRIKESDRLRAMTECINNLGGNAEETPDGIIINGTGSLRGGRVDGFNDHRVVMSAAIASCICEKEVIIDGAEAVNKSYPTFFEDFKKLGGVIDV